MPVKYAFVTVVIEKKSQIHLSDVPSLSTMLSPDPPSY